MARECGEAVSQSSSAPKRPSPRPLEQGSNTAFLGIRDGKDAVALRELCRCAVQDLDRKVISKSLQAHHWQQKQTERGLKISNHALLYKIRNAILESESASFRSSQLSDAD